MGILQIIITLLVLFALSLPLGKYIYKIISGEKSFVDPVIDKVDLFLYRVTGIKKDEQMNWKQYALALIVSNLVLTAILFAVLKLQGFLWLNPNHVGGMETWLSFSTAISFITNTNFQSYSGETGVSYLTQMMLTCFMFAAPATGLALTAAFIRGISGHSEKIGNFYVDLIRFTTRLLLPLAIIVSLVYAFQGVPQSLAANLTVHTIEGTEQTVPLGPVASLESIKNIASNGGGFFGANSAHPFENPTPLTNIITIVLLGLVSTATIFAFGHTIKNKKQAWVFLGAAAVLLALSIGAIYYSEARGNPMLEKIGLSQSMGNMEGKEARFSIAEDSLFAAGTTAYQVGATNAAHDSFMPIGQAATLWNMMLQAVFGGKGTGFAYIIISAILTVFICGLMVGRTPEFLGKKIEGKEIKMVAIIILLHPFLVLFPTAISLLISKAAASITNPGFHGLTQVLYNFTSASANNGSAFAGMNTNTAFYNITMGLVMLIARYIPMIAMLAIAGSMGAKKTVAESVGTFRTDNAVFAVTLVMVIIIVGALTFFPALSLGPIAEQLMMVR